MYWIASSRESAIPTSAMWRLRGIHGIPPDTPVVPPMRSAFSRRSTSAPPSWARVAATRPAAPDPSTTTSTTRSHCGRWVIMAASLRGRPAEISEQLEDRVPSPCPRRRTSPRSPTLWPRRRSSLIVVTTMRAPVAAMGCPRPQPLPLTLTMSWSSPSCREQATAMRAERLVDLEQLDVVDLHPGPLERLGDRPASGPGRCGWARCRPTPRRRSGPGGATRGPPRSRRR